jgi:hypothetical protein
MFELSGLKRKEYLLKCFNRAMMRHIQMSQEQAPSMFVIRQNDDDVELLEMSTQSTLKKKQIQDDSR